MGRPTVGQICRWDTNALIEAANDLRYTAGLLAELSDAMPTAAAISSSWTGEAAEAARSAISAMCAYVDSECDSFDQAAAALDTAAWDIQDAQEVFAQVQRGVGPFGDYLGVLEEDGTVAVYDLPRTGPDSMVPAPTDYASRSDAENHFRYYEERSLMALQNARDADNDLSQKLRECLEGIDPPEPATWQVWTSNILNFTPGISTIKGILEGVDGNDLFTGQDLGTAARLLGAIPFGAIAGRVLLRAYRGTTALQELGRLRSAVQADGALRGGVNYLGSYFRSGSQLADDFANMSQTGGHFSVAALGGGSAVRMADTGDLNPAELAARLRADPTYVPGTPVELVTSGELDPAYVAALADDLGVSVRVPSHTAGHAEDGTPLAAQNGADELGPIPQIVPGGGALIFHPTTPIAPPTGSMPIIPPPPVFIPPSSDADSEVSTSDSNGDGYDVVAPGPDPSYYGLN